LSIRTRLLLLVFAVWLPAVAGFALLAYSTYTRETAAAKERVRQAAESINTVVERELDKRVIMAKTLAASSAVRDRKLAQFHFEATAATKGTGDWAFLFDKTAQLTNTALPFDETTARSRRIDAPLETREPTVHFNTTGQVVKKPVLAVFAPESNTADVQVNVGIGFEPSVIQAVLNQHEMPGGSIGAILDGDVRVMARSRDPEKWLGLRGTGEVNRRIRAGEYGFVSSTTLDGVPSLTYLSRPNLYGWSVVVAYPMAALDRSAQRATLQAAAASGVLLLLGLGLALVFASGISSPIDALRQSADELARDRVPSRLATGLKEADEVAVVLHQAGLRSAAATKTLESRVAEAVAQAREAQATLLEARKHEAIGRLTGGIAHDFNNLLQTISTGHHVLERSVREGPQRRVLESVMRATAKAADSIKQMLAFGRAENLEPRPIDLADFLLKSQELIQKAVGERIRLSAHVAPDLPALFVDPTQLELALLNIIFNARDAMPAGGNITIVGRCPFPEERAVELGLVCIEVTDDGSGIDEQTLTKVFEPYFTTKPVGGGSGLGLAQASAFAKKSGGDIEIQSEVGVGTTVRFFLPSTGERPNTPGVAQTNQIRAPRPLAVLMVEDDALVASVVLSALEGAGHTVTAFSSADEAQHALMTQRQEFDVLFTDVVMPGAMTGIDLVDWCREHHPDLPAVVATGYSQQAADVQARVLRKPYAIADLLVGLQDAASGPPRSSERA